LRLVVPHYYRQFLGQCFHLFRLCPVSRAKASPVGRRLAGIWASDISPHGLRRPSRLCDSALPLFEDRMSIDDTRRRRINC